MRYCLSMKHSCAKWTADEWFLWTIGDKKTDYRLNSKSNAIDFTQNFSRWPLNENIPRIEMPFGKTITRKTNPAQWWFNREMEDYKRLSLTCPHSLNFESDIEIWPIVALMSHINASSSILLWNIVEYYHVHISWSSWCHEVHALSTSKSFSVKK